MSENDYLKIKIQLVQFQTDVEQALVNKAPGAVGPPATIRL